MWGDQPSYKRYSDDPYLDEKEFDKQMRRSLSIGDTYRIKQYVKDLEARLHEKGCDLDAPNGLNKLEVESPIRRWAQRLMGLDKSQREHAQVVYEVLKVLETQDLLQEDKELATKHYQSSKNKDIFDSLQLIHGFKDIIR